MNYPLTFFIFNLTMAVLSSCHVETKLNHYIANIHSLQCKYFDYCIFKYDAVISHPVLSTPGGLCIVTYLWSW